MVMWRLWRDKPFVNQAAGRGRDPYTETDGEEEEGITLGGGGTNREEG